MLFKDLKAEPFILNSFSLGGQLQKIQSKWSFDFHQPILTELFLFQTNTNRCYNNNVDSHQMAVSFGIHLVVTIFSYRLCLSYFTGDVIFLRENQCFKSDSIGNVDFQTQFRTQLLLSVFDYPYIWAAE